MILVTLRVIFFLIKLGYLALHKADAIIGIFNINGVDTFDHFFGPGRAFFQASIIGISQISRGHVFGIGGAVFVPLTGVRAFVRNDFFGLFFLLAPVF